MDTIGANLQAVKARIEAAATACRREPREIALVAVSKTFAADHVATAHRHGQRAFGENYVQEALRKVVDLGNLSLEWHFIGPIQSNKTKAIAENFAWVHTIDRLKIAQRLSAARPPRMQPLQVCIEVNVGGEQSKSGVVPGEALELARNIVCLPQLKLRGLMTIPPAETDPARQRLHFARLREIRDEIRATGIALDTLSMGMSTDLEAAIIEGATIVRVGTAIFGERRTTRTAVA